MADCYIVRRGNVDTKKIIGGLKNTTCQFNFETMTLSDCTSSSSSGNNILANSDGTDFIFAPGNNDWEICFKFRFDTLKGMSVIIGSAYYRQYMYAPSIELTEGEGNLWFGVSTDGSNWDIQGATGTGTIEAGKDYWVKLSYSSASGYQYSLSEDGKNYDIKHKTSGTNVQYQSQYSKMQLFDVACSGTHINETGSIDLTESYIKYGDTVVWGNIG